MDKLEQAGMLLVVPIMVGFFDKMKDYLDNHPSYEKILFGARDGWLMQKLYDGLRERNLFGSKWSSSIYLLTSRKLCLRAAAYKRGDLSFLERYLTNTVHPDKIFTILGCDPAPLITYDEKQSESIEEFYRVAFSQVRNELEKTYISYTEYLNEVCIDTTERYLFCDLISQGTVQFALNTILDTAIEGFYLATYKHINDPLDVCVSSPYTYKFGNYISLAHQFLETVFSAPVPSIDDISENGEPIYAKEPRTKDQIECMLCIQENVEKHFFEFYDLLYVSKYPIDAHTMEAYLKYYDKVEYAGECCQFAELELLDDMMQIRYKVFNKR